MGYSVKWVQENLGITRDMLRHYEKEQLLSTNETRNRNNGYRDYTNDDVERIWGIKLLIGIGFHTKEIYAMINDCDFNFEAAIEKKIVELEQKYNENVKCLQFAKSIKLAGQIPTVTEIGSVKFDDFLTYAHENWNFFDASTVVSCVDAANEFISEGTIDRCLGNVPMDMLGLLESLDAEDIVSLLAIGGYFQVLSDMKDLAYDSDAVQTVVRLLYEYQVKHIADVEMTEKFTVQFFVNQTASLFLEGDVARWFEDNYGKDGCLFIAQALACYAGYDIEDL